MNIRHHRSIRQIISALMLTLQLCRPEWLSGQELARDSFLENGLSYFFAKEFGYVLVGEKAVAVDGCQNLDFIYNPQKIEAVFLYLRSVLKNSKKLIFKLRSFEGKIYEVELIHRSSLSSIIANEPTVRAFVLKKYDTEENFFHVLEDPKISIFEALNFDDFLLGLVFGYGKSNARYYTRRIKVGRYLKKYPLVWLLPFVPQPHPSVPKVHRMRIKDPYMEASPPPPTRFSSLEEEWRRIRKVSNSSWREKRAPVPYLIQIPSYISRTGKDADAARAKFLGARDKVAKLFCQSSLQEAIAAEVEKP